MLHLYQFNYACHTFIRAIQVYCDLLETVGGLLALALAPRRAFLPAPHAQALLYSPIIGQVSS